jgi:hypothetical protein
MRVEWMGWRILSVLYIAEPLFCMEDRQIALLKGRSMMKTVHF